MSRRIEIELTSSRPDGSWTWRAAGAREPKGVLDGSMLHDGAKPGEVLRAEADFELEGIQIISVSAPKVDHRQEPDRIEVLGPQRPDTPGVTTQLFGRSEGGARPPRSDRDRQGRDSQEGRPRRDRSGGPGAAGRPPSRRPSGPAAGDKQDGGTSGGDRQERERSAPRRGSNRPPRRADETSSANRSDGERSGRDRTGGDRGSERRGAEGHRDGRRGGEPAQTRSRRLNPGHTHRNAVLESLPPEHRPIAEQVLRGGIPAVRTALHLEREKASAEGRPPPKTDELIAIAEALLPRLKAAEWRDRAEAAVTDVDGLSLRDLRSVVTGSDVARDDETRALAATLRDALAARTTAMHEEWTAEIGKLLDEGRVVRAVRLSSRPPEPSARMSEELADRLSSAAGQAMSPDTSADLWGSLLDAVAASPIRRTVAPLGLPEDAPADLRKAAHQQSGNIPALAKLLGVSIPPPPRPGAARRRPDPPRRRTPGEARTGPSSQLDSAQPAGSVAGEADTIGNPGGSHVDAPADPVDVPADPIADPTADPVDAPADTVGDAAGSTADNEQPVEGTAEEPSEDPPSELVLEDQPVGSAER